MTRIPVILDIHIETDGFYISKNDKLPWTGFEKGLQVIEDLRILIETKT